jgi:hypothetical protein
VNHKDPFNGGYEIYHPLVSPKAPIARPAAFAGTKIAIPSGTTRPATFKTFLKGAKASPKWDR